MNAVYEETLRQYYGLLKDVLEEHGLMNCPAQIYNVDESGLPLPRCPNVIAQKGTKKVRYRTSGKKGQVTIVGSASATGQVLPPFVIFDATKLQQFWTVHEVPGTRYGLSSKGWIEDIHAFRYTCSVCTTTPASA